MRALAFTVAVGLTGLALRADGQRPRPRATMATTARWMQARAMGDSFAVQVALPTRYAMDTTRRYGTLIVLDGDKSFGLARDLVDWLSWSGANEVVPLIVVGIGYGGTEAEWWQKRSRDLTPTKDRSRVWGDWPIAGAAGAFQQFLRTDLVPTIDREYRTLPDQRIIAGVSFGGLFATWSLLQDRSPFTAAIAVNPAFVWDSTAIAIEVRNRRGRGGATALHLYTAVGDQDDEATMQRPWRQVVQGLRELGAPFRIEDEILRGETHISSWPVGLAHGLKRVAAPPRRPTGGANK